MQWLEGSENMMIFGLFMWSLFGIFIVAMCHMTNFGGVFNKTEGFEYVNPIHIYKYNHVNWFGAIVVATIYSFICPLGTIGYWCYKLCTVGRK